MASIAKEDVIEFISNMSVLELSEFVKELEEKFGVSAAAPVAMAAMFGTELVGNTGTRARARPPAAASRSKCGIATRSG